MKEMERQNGTDATLLQRENQRKRERNVRDRETKWETANEGERIN